MRTYKGQNFSPTVTPGPKRRKPKPLRRLDRPDRDKLVRKKKPSAPLSPGGRKGNRNSGRQTPGRTTPPTQPVDPFAAQVKAALDLKYSGEQQALQQELAISGQQHANTDDYYQRYLNDLEKAAQFTTQAYGQGQQGVYAQGTAAAGQDQARMAQNQQQAQASAAVRGTSAAPQVEQAGAIGARQAQAGAFGGLLAAHGGAAATLNEGRYAAGAAARVGAHQQEQAREGMAREEARKLVAQRSADEGTVRQELSDAAFKRRLLAKEFGLDVRKQKGEETKAKRDARQKKRELRLERLDTKADNRRLSATERRNARNLAETMRKNRATEAQDRVEEQGRNLRDQNSGSSGPSNLTPTQRRDYNEDYGQAVTSAKAYIEDGKFVKGANYEKVLAALAKDMPAEIAKAGLLKALGKPVPGSLAKKLRRLGVRVPRPKPPGARPMSQLPGPF